MTYQLGARAKETTTTTGTGTITLTGASPSFRRLRSVVADGQTFQYTIEQVFVDSSGAVVGGDWESGIGTLTYGTVDTVARTLVVESSNGNSAVDFGSGTKDIYITPVAKALPVLGVPATAADANKFIRLKADLSSYELIANIVYLAAAIVTGDAGKAVVVNGTGTGFSLLARPDAFPAGTRLIFPQAAAPTGWVQDTSVNDRMISITSGAGGWVSGAWTISGLVVGGRTMTVANMANHDHPYIGGNVNGGVGLNDDAKTSTQQATGGTGSNQAHDHPITHDGSWRPAYYASIIATKV